jgi:hypothetical protein
MQNINRFLILGLLVAAALFATGMLNTASFQQAYAVQDNRCHDNVVGVCANVCAQVVVIGEHNKNQC